MKVSRGGHERQDMKGKNAGHEGPSRVQRLATKGAKTEYKRCKRWAQRMQR